MSRAPAAESTGAAPAGADLDAASTAHHQPRDGDGLEPRHQLNRIDVAVTGDDESDIGRAAGPPQPCARSDRDGRDVSDPTGPRQDRDRDGEGSLTP